MITKIFEDGGQRSDSNPATNQNIMFCFIVIELEVATHSEMDANITSIEFQYLNDVDSMCLKLNVVGTDIDLVPNNHWIERILSQYLFGMDPFRDGIIRLFDG